jgi:sugar/nucleoside kinase (ribokinase family)
VGGDGIGDEIRQNLKTNNVNYSLMKIYPKDRSSFSFIVNTGTFKEHVIFSYRGANYMLKIETTDLKKFKTKWFYLTSLQGDVWQKNLHTIFKVASEQEVKVAWNPGNTQLATGYKFLKRYLKLTQVFNLNKDEAIELVLLYGKKVSDIEKLLITIKSWGPHIVVITDGANGAYAFDGKKIYYKKAKNIKGINTTGAGDSFFSAFIWSLLKHNDINLALQAGIINSNNVITEIGAQNGLLTARQIKKQFNV